MGFDYKKMDKALYMPPKAPGVIDVPPMRYLAVRGVGDPNEENGAYHHAVQLLYGMAYTIKMSHRGGRAIDGFFDFVVPPLEGLWWQGGSGKDAFHWISLIRLPDFVDREDFDWALQEASRKKKQDFSAVEFFPYHEGLCVQCMHIGSYDDEEPTIAAMDAYAAEQGYRVDISPARRHHEIYLSDPRKTAVETRKTVLRHPIKRP